MSRADHSRHLALAQAALASMAPPGPTASLQIRLAYAQAHALAALAASAEPAIDLGGEMPPIETREADTRQH